jgi:death on curing protein
MDKRINRNISVQDLIDLHQMALELYGGPGGIRDEGTLYYLVDKSSHYRNPIEISSVLLHGIATLHPFNDGNKRVSLMAACLVLGLYDSALTASNEESKIFVLAVAKYEITEEQVRYWILKNSIMSKSH